MILELALMILALASLRAWLPSGLESCIVHRFWRPALYCDFWLASRVGSASIWFGRIIGWVAMVAG